MKVNTRRNVTMSSMTKAEIDSHEITREGRTWTLIFPDGDKYRGFRTQKEAIKFILDDFVTSQIRC
jgi:hypothetical protein